MGSHFRRATGRDPALDLLRVVALIRVVLWHVLAATWMTFFAAIPLMFFVAGTLLNASRSRRSYRSVVFTRARRLLIPLWAYGVVVATATGVRAQALGQPARLTTKAAVHASTWFLPIVDPAGSSWQGGWLSDHLWYLRAYFWMVLLAPVLALLARRLLVAIPVFGAAIALLEVAARHRLPVIGAGSTRVLVGDAVTYGLFVVLGMAYARHRRTLRPWLPAIGAAVAAAGTVAYIALAGLPGGDVNQSYPAIALVGMTWLLATGAAERPIRRLAERRIVADIGRVVSGRAETIYLWHPAAIVLAYVITDHGPIALIITVTVLLTALATMAVGWVEDIAGAGRSHARKQWRRLRAVRFPVLIPPAAVTLAVATPFLALPAAASASRPSSSAPVVRPPSYREALSDTAFSPAPPSTTTTTAPPQPRPVRPTTPPTTKTAPAPVTTQRATTAATTAAATAATVQAALQRWAAAHPAVGAIAVAVGIDGQVWTADARRGAATMRASDRYGVASITKSFTIALVLQEAVAGRIDLDAPVPALEGVADLPDGVAITPRQLLQHTSGLVDYSLADGFDQSQRLAPAEAVSLSVRTKVLFTPGTDVHYANSNYLWLGLLLEHVTGRSYHDLVAELAASVGVQHTAVDARDIPGWTGFSSGGITSTVGDVARFEQALFTPGRLLPPSMVTELVTLDDHNVALGTWPLCPCAIAADGRHTYTMIGHYVGNGGSYHYPDGITLVVHVDPPSANSDAMTVSLGQALRAALGR